MRLGIQVVAKAPKLTEEPIAAAAVSNRREQIKQPVAVSIEAVGMDTFSGARILHECCDIIVVRAESGPAPNILLIGQVLPLSGCREFVKRDEKSALWQLEAEARAAARGGDLC